MRAALAMVVLMTGAQIAGATPRLSITKTEILEGPILRIACELRDPDGEVDAIFVRLRQKGVPRYFENVNARADTKVVIRVTRGTLASDHAYELEYYLGGYRTDGTELELAGSSEAPLIIHIPAAPVEPVAGDHTTLFTILGIAGTLAVGAATAAVIITARD